jgi:protein-tyrosine phosphatase
VCARRSVTLLLAYLMLSKGMTLAAALEHVRWVGGGRLET